VFHRKGIVNQRGDFAALRDPEVEARFNCLLLELLCRWEYLVTAVVIDKKAHRDVFGLWKYHPDNYCMAVMLEQFVAFLKTDGSLGDVMAE
jgi:hypothetical protein